MTTQTLPDNRRAIMAIIMASYLMILIDVSIVITGLPKIQAGLGFSTVGLSWVQNAYTLALGGLLLLGARAGDILGRRRMLLLGLAIFTLSSLAIGLAQTPAWLLAARAVQGAGSAILAPATLALLSTHFAEGPERTRALSLYAATAGIGATLGLVLGGLFAELLSWRAGFFINLPIGALLMLATRRYIQETPTHSGQLDIGGAASSTLGMTALVYGLVRAAEQGWGDWLTITALTGGLGLLGIFLLIQARARQPILPLRLFASRERSGAYAARMLFLGGMVGFWFFTTQFLQGVLGFTPLQAGLAFLPATLPNFLSAMLVPRLTPRVGSARLLAFGLLACLGGLTWLGQVSAGTHYVSGVALPMMLIGFGQGVVLPPLTVFAVAGVARQDAGAASGLVNVAHQLGGAIGLGVLVVVFAAAVPVQLAGVPLLAHRIAMVMDGSAVMLSLALLASLVLILPAHARKPVPAGMPVAIGQVAGGK
ncbi:MFS transporter [Pseudogulbenkiania ferrooxidans]|uniref:Major facilitator superfamily MFS_1 n=1 Tax=Pseudogulbenkiania ferrooxidans 2002 TaxID=279714 RepID=B9YZX7_9NEIS|nr:MFS transporter [Pseudogulbenkiania ferrooxidans]EEG09860.1 major facilitator superfamily MFS_1 [Pseudogulbenkiania ferrooxidans 2002]